MGILDKLRARVKKGKETVVDTTAKVGNYVEKKSSDLVEKIPGGHGLKEKANHYTEKTVNRIGDETENIMKEGKTFVDEHMHKKDDVKKDPEKPTDHVSPKK